MVSSDGSQPATRLGFWLALLTAATAVLALAVAVTTLPRSGPYCRTGCVVGYPYTDAGAFVPRDYWWLYPALGLTLLAVILAAVLHSRIPPRRLVLSRIGNSFVAIAAALLLVDYTIQLTVLQPALLSGETEGLSPWSQYHPYGLFIAFENAGYAILNVGFAFLGVALLGTRARLEQAAGWVFLSGAALTAAALVYYPLRYGPRLDYRFEVASILLSWLTLIAAPALLAVAWARQGALAGRGLSPGRDLEGRVPARRRVAGDIVIGRPVEVVFDVLADERNEPAYNPRLHTVDLITPGPIGRGTRFRARAGSGRRPFEMIIEWTEFVRPHRLGSTTTLPSMTIDGVLLLDPVDSSTRLRWSWDLRPRGTLRMAGPVLRMLGRRQERRIWRSLKRYLEQAPVPEPQPQPRS